MTIQEYTERTYQALCENHPRTMPCYADDPVRVWRYICRCYGAGLSIYADDEIRDIVPTLYGKWLVARNLSHNLPKVTSNLFNSWIWDAAWEARNAQNCTP